MEAFDPASIKKQIMQFIAKSAPANGVVLGISGGIDSALVLALCVEALGPQKVLGLFMPEAKADIAPTIKEYTQKLGIPFEIIPIKPLVDAFLQHGSVAKDQKVSGNLKARIRMSLLYSRSNAKGLVVMGTGNKSELLAGYFTKFGDGGVDFLPIGDLYKSHVRQLAKYVGVPQPIIDQPPSADLWQGQTDEAEMGITYEKLDMILKAHFDDNTLYEDIALPGISDADITKVKQLCENAKFKLSLPPICQLKL